MVEIMALGSSSSGNCYIISDQTTRIMLEAGVSFRNIQRGSGFTLSQVAGCLVSHRHGDHAKAVKDVIRAGIPLYASNGTLDALGVSGYLARPIKEREAFYIGSWRVLPFEAHHDVEQPLNFLLASKHGYKLLFVTDSFYCSFRFDGLTHIMIETNYSRDLLDQSTMDPIVKRRLYRSHMSLETAIDFLKANDLSKVQEIWLIHLSDSNSSEDMFKRKIQMVTGKQVYVAGS